MTPSNNGIGRLEIAKDTAQMLVETAATHVGRIAAILTGAIREITNEVGDLATDVFEMRDAAGRASAGGAESDHVPDHESDRESD